MGKYKLTAAFLAISAVTLIVAALIILKVSTSQEERNIASMTTEQSARDGRHDGRSHRAQRPSPLGCRAAW